MSESETSRRWILRLGAGAVLTGFRGEPAECAETLPPGLFLPASDHLAHVIQAAARSRPLTNYEPEFFTPGELEKVRTTVAVLLGDIPNASQVTRDIANWIDLTVNDSADVRAAANSLSAAHRALAVAHYGEESVNRLETFDPQKICREGLAEMPSPILDRPAEGAAARFVEYLKSAAIDGYYTSKEGLRELDYRGNSFYAEPPGCTHY